MPPIDLKTIDVVQGARLSRTAQGQDLDGSTPTVFLDTDTLTGTVWMAQGQPAAITFTPTWWNAGLCQFTVTLTESQTAGLALDAEYNLQVFASRDGVKYCIGWVLLRVLPAAGSQAAATPPDLIGGAYAQQMLGQLGLTEAQLEILPSVISAASAAVRSYCNRLFTKMDITEVLPVELDGTIRLREIPVNQVYRIQCDPQPALAITNASATSAWVYQQSTGDIYSGLVITGLVLNWQSGGVTSNTVIPYSADETIASVAAAVNAAGNGWSATADDVLGLWPVTEIYDGADSKGASPGDQPNDGAVFHVFSRNVTNSRPHPDDGQKTGIWRVGRQPSGGDPWARMGLDWGAYDSGGSGDGDAGLVKVSYNAGFTAVSAEIQLAVVELAKYELERLRTDLFLISETASEYSYQLNPNMIMALPPNVLQAISRYRITNA